jgi:hypothetical protein
MAMEVLGAIRPEPDREAKPEKTPWALLTRLLRKWGLEGKWPGNHSINRGNKQWADRGKASVIANQIVDIPIGVNSL